MSTESQKDWAGFHGRMDRYTKENGKMVSSMEMVLGKEQKVTHTLDNGSLERLMGMAFMFG